MNLIVCLKGLILCYIDHIEIVLQDSKTNILASDFHELLEGVNKIE